MRPRSLLVLVSLLAGCASSHAPATSPSSVGCEGLPNGPFAQIVQGPRAAAIGGSIADGTYDLVYAVVDELDPRPDRGIGPLRWELTFQTEQRDAVHQEGRLVWRTSVPPANDCSVGRFAVVGAELRVYQPKIGLDAVTFSTTPDGFVMIAPGGGTLDPKAYVFRRR